MLTASVIIPNLHSPLLGEVLAALERQTEPPREVIVVGQDRYGFCAAHPQVRSRSGRYTDGGTTISAVSYPVFESTRRW